MNDGPPLQANPHSGCHHPEVRPWQERIRIGGFEPFSTVDWPDMMAGVVFLMGCPWRCGYCQNPELQSRPEDPGISWSRVEEMLLERRDWLDGVVFSGGEPTIDSALPSAIRTVRALGFRVALHTGGGYPERLMEVLPLLDWVGFDIKADAAHYDAITGAKGSAFRAMRSAKLLLDSGVPHEFRMTYHSGLLSEDAVLRATDSLAALGATEFVLQEFRATGVVKQLPPHRGIAASLLHSLEERFAQVRLRSSN